MIFETHAHYDDARFEEDRDNLLSSLPESGIGVVINCGAAFEGNSATLSFTKKYDHVYGALGIHPSNIEEMNEEVYNWIRTTILDQEDGKKIVAIGEVGLDYYWDKEPEVQANQRYWFTRQIELAKELKLPLIIHSRDAAEETFRLMKEYHAEEVGGVIHCYSYSKELAEEFVKLGYYIGIGGVVTFKNARKLVETVEAIPLERLLLETDCPYMAPEPYRGKRNSSLYLPYVAEKIAQIKGVSIEEVERVTEANARRLFKKVK